MNGPYADHILDSSDVCSNCFRTVRVERLDPTRNGFAGELESHYERKRKHTQIGYGPADSVTEIKGVFCNCGVEGSYERLWDPTDISEERLKELIKHCLRSLKSKGVTLKWKETAAYILQSHRDTEDADVAFSRGIEMGITATVASGENPMECHERLDE